MFCQFRCSHKKRGEPSFPALKRILGSFVTSRTPLHQWLGKAALQRLASPSQSNITPGRRQLRSRTGQAELRCWEACRGERWPYFSSRQVNRGHSNSAMPRGGSHSFTYQTVTLWGVPGIAPERLFQEPGVSHGFGVKTQGNTVCHEKFYLGKQQLSKKS